MFMNKSDTKILFFGAFDNSGLSGNSSACSSLVQSDNLMDYHFLLIDSAIPLLAIKKNRLVNRIFRLLKRINKTFYHFLFSKPQIALIFCNDGFSFIEKGIYALCCKVLGIKVILAPRSGEIINNNKNKLFNFFFKRVVKKSDLVMVQGEYWKSYYNAFCKSKKIRVIKNWVSQDAKSYKIPLLLESKEKIELVFVGWLAYRKNLKCLTSAINVLSHQGVNLKLDIYGEGPLKPEIQNYISKNNLDKTIFLRGWANSEVKREIYKRQPILVLPSIFEGMPNVVLEAMAYGLPVIASDIVTIPELIDDGVNGLLFNSNDENNLAEKIKLLGGDSELQSKFIHNAKFKIEQFSLNTQSEKIDHLFMELVSSNI